MFSFLSYRTSTCSRRRALADSGTQNPISKTLKTPVNVHVPVCIGLVCSASCSTATPTCSRRRAPVACTCALCALECVPSMFRLHPRRFPRALGGRRLRACHPSTYCHACRVPWYPRPNISAWLQVGTAWAVRRCLLGAARVTCLAVGRHSDIETLSLSLVPEKGGVPGAQVEVYDGTAAWLKGLELDDDALTKANHRHDRRRGFLPAARRQGPHRAAAPHPQGQRRRAPAAPRPDPGHHRAGLPVRARDSKKSQNACI